VANRVTLQVNGPDKAGVFAQLCQYLADTQINILDIAQNVLRGYLSITFLLDIEQASSNRDRLELDLNRLCRELGLTAKLYDYEQGQRPKIKDLYVFSMMGMDRKGILARITAILADHRANIDTINLQVRNNWIYNQLILDLGNTPDVEKLRNELRVACEELNLSVVLQQEAIYRKNKKLIAFDMDSTLVKGETIVEIAKHVDMGEEMEQATNYAMENNVDFSKSLRDRAKLIAGIDETTLHEVANNLEITPGAEELIHHLKMMGWKIAIISSGFSVFTEVVKKQLGLDYAFGNKLEIVNGKVTGNVIGDIIDGPGKWDIVTELANQLDITAEEVVTVGDGSNDIFMLEKSGLGIGLNSKEIASEVADGRVTENDVSMILLMLGLSDTEIDRILREKL
jgi:phosphoserine phosphatase